MRQLNSNSKLEIARQIFYRLYADGLSQNALSSVHAAFASYGLHLHRRDSTSVVPTTHAATSVAELPPRELQLSTSHRRPRLTRYQYVGEVKSSDGWAVSQPSLKEQYQRERQRKEVDENYQQRYQQVFGEAKYLAAIGSEPLPTKDKEPATEPAVRPPPSKYRATFRGQRRKQLARYLFPQTYRLVYDPAPDSQPQQPMPPVKTLVKKYRVKDLNKPTLSEDDQLYLLYLASPTMLAPQPSDELPSMLERELGQSFFDTMVQAHVTAAAKHTLEDQTSPLALTDTPHNPSTVAQSIAVTLATQPTLARYLVRQHERSLAIRQVLRPRESARSIDDEGNEAQTYALALSRLYFDSKEASSSSSEAWFQSVKDQTSGQDRLKEALEVDRVVAQQRQAALSRLEERRKATKAKLAGQGAYGLGQGEAGLYAYAQQDMLYPFQQESLRSGPSRAALQRFGVAARVQGDPTGVEDQQQEPQGHRVDDDKLSKARTPWKVSQWTQAESYFPFERPPRAAQQERGRETTEPNQSEQRKIEFQAVENTTGGGYSSDLLEDLHFDAIRHPKDRRPAFEKDARGITHVKRIEPKAQLKGAALVVPRRKSDIPLDTNMLLDMWYSSDRKPVILDEGRFQEQLVKDSESQGIP